ncbi:MAG: peptidase T [Clostridia bacterium]|nr:peptidase T [Clostridia bacterium]
MKASERLLKYVTIYTGSDESGSSTPSTPEQFDLANILATDMKEIGLSDVSVDEHAYVYGFLPATPGCENCKSIGLIAHLDIVNEFGARNICPQIIEHYDGNPIMLGTSGRTIDVQQFPELKQAVGQTIITTDGTTVLGADDKAGIAEILTMCEILIAENRPHGKICVCFTPDEEIGHGAALLDLEKFGADYGYTVDGSAPNEIEYETFHAASADWKIRGVSVHPGDAKDKMINAALVAMEINHMLPAEEIPAKTTGREGFFHLCQMEGDVSSAKLSYIIRDHDRERFRQRKAQMAAIETAINETYGAGTAVLTMCDQYQNMAEIICQYPEVVEKAKEAICLAGMKPVSNPVRGGTDGAQLSFRGLPCPNLGTGAYALHGPYEHAVAEQMDMVVEILLQLTAQYAEN